MPGLWWGHHQQTGLSPDISAGRVGHPVRVYPQNKLHCSVPNAGIRPHLTFSPSVRGTQVPSKLSASQRRLGNSEPCWHLWYTSPGLECSVAG